jgi:type I restriction enzyme S subunit
MPNPWPVVSLGELLTPVSRPEPVNAEKTYHILGAHWYAQGLYTKEVTAGTGVRANALYRVEQGDFVYNRLFAWKGSFALANKQNHGCYVSNEFPCFAVNASRLDGQFLFRYFSRSSIWDDALSESTGGTPTSRNRLKEGKFLGFKIPLPPLDEQRRIVARIEQLAAKIEDARHVRQTAMQEAETYRESAAAVALDCRGATTVGDFIRIQSGYAFKSEWFTSTGIRLVRNVNIGHGSINWDQTARIPGERHSEFSAFELHHGDVLISLDRPIISTGVKVAMVKQGDIPSLLLQRVGRAQFLNDRVLSDFFFAWLRSPHYARSIDPGRSNGVPHISPNDVERISFSPPPVNSQRRIVAYLDNLQAKVDALKRLQAETAAELDALLPSVLDDAFKGGL